MNPHINKIKKVKSIGGAHKSVGRGSIRSGRTAAGSIGPTIPLYFKSKSHYHNSCVPSPQPKAAATQIQATPSKLSQGAYSKCDVVTQDEIWKQAVNIEKKGVKSWEQNWGFLTEFDSKGRPRSAKSIPEEVVMYSDSPNIPNTNSGNYGLRLNTTIGKVMQDLEFKFNSGTRKKKLGDDLVCY